MVLGKNKAPGQLGRYSDYAKIRERKGKKKKKKEEEEEEEEESWFDFLHEKHKHSPVF